MNVKAVLRIANRNKQDRPRPDSGIALRILWYCGI
jgi:hypothetical protein